MSAQKFRFVPDNAQRSVWLSGDAAQRLERIDDKHGSQLTRVFLRVGWCIEAYDGKRYHMVGLQSDFAGYVKGTNTERYRKPSERDIEFNLLKAVPCICYQCVTSIRAWLANDPKAKHTKQLMQGVKWAIRPELFQATFDFRERIAHAAMLAHVNDITLTTTAYDEVLKLLK